MGNIELKNFEDEYMVKVKGGRYIPSFANELKEVFDIEVCKYPTTQLMWLDVMEDNPSEVKGINKPVETISWWRALEYCNRLSKKYGLKPVYDLSKSEQEILTIRELNGKIVSPDKVNFKNTEGFRLPTEIEWEWFARGGQRAIDEGTFDYIYSGSNNIDEVAWYLNNSDFKKHNISIKDVGLKKPNQLGLFECSGNVWEWCYDTIGDIENGRLYTYKAFKPDSIYRRIKGGSGAYSAKNCAISYHSETIATYSYKNFGLRIIRTI